METGGVVIGVKLGEVILASKISFECNSIGIWIENDPYEFVIVLANT